MLFLYNTDSGMAAIVQIAGGSAINSEATAIITQPLCASEFITLKTIYYTPSISQRYNQVLTPIKR
jgi:hypothetical protein